MDFDRNHFLTDVFEELILDMSHSNHRNPPTGDPVRYIDHAVDLVIDRHVKELRALAQDERVHIITMAEEKAKNPREPVKTLWRQASGSENYDRRATTQGMNVDLRPALLGPGVETFPEAKALLKQKGRAHTIVTDRKTGLLHVVRNLDLHHLGGGRFVQEPLPFDHQP